MTPYARAEADLTAALLGVREALARIEKALGPTEAAQHAHAAKLAMLLEESAYLQLAKERGGVTGEAGRNSGSHL